MYKGIGIFFFIMLFGKDFQAQSLEKPKASSAEVEFSTVAGWSEMAVVTGGQFVYRVPVSRDLWLGIGVQSLVTGDGKGHHGIFGEVSTRFGSRDQIMLGVQLGKSIGYKKQIDDFYMTPPATTYYFDKERTTQMNLMYHFKSKGRLQYSLGGFFLVQNARLNHYPKGAEPVILDHGIRTSVVSAGIRFAVSF